MKKVIGGCSYCLKCQGEGGCAFYYIDSSICWDYGDAGCKYGFACGPCNNLSPC